MAIKKIVSLVLITSLLAGCNPPPPGAGQDTGGISKQDIGTVAGGVGGALLGSMIGGGNGRIVAAAGGAILGGFAGSSIGKSLDNADALKAQQATQQALENGQTGQSTPWKNPDSGHSGTVVPKAPYQTADGTYCREFTQTINVGGQSKQAYGTACRQPDGSWKITQQ
jgi:surface antigen